MSPPAKLRATAALILAVIGAACTESRPVDPATAVVALIGQRTYTVAEFLHYLENNLVAGHELNDPGDETAAVKSRLFDAFVEERLLLLEADREELSVSDFEVEAYLGLNDGARESSVTRSDWAEASRRLKIEKLLEATMTDLPAGPVATTPTRPPPETGRGRRLRLRSLMLESPEQAAKVSKEIRRGRVTFDEAIVSHASAPEQGMPLELSWDTLSDDHRRVLEGLKPGQVSQPLDVGGGSYLFQIEAWLEEDPQDPETLAEDVRRRRATEQRAEALRALLSRLRKNVEIKVYLDLLPFRYVPEDSENPTAWNKVSPGRLS